MSDYDEGVRDGAAREKLREHDLHLKAINGNIADMTQAVHSVEVTLSLIAGKLKVWGIIGMIAIGILSPVITGLVVHFFTR